MTAIAIVDKDEDSRDVLQVLMEGEGHSVEQFKSGKDFLSTFTPGLFKLQAHPNGSVYAGHGRL